MFAVAVKGPYRKFRGNDSQEEFAHMVLCTWADEIRGGVPRMSSVLSQALMGTSDRAPDFSEQSAVVDRLVCKAPLDVRVILDGYYRFGRPREALCNILQVESRGFYIKMARARQYIHDGIYQSGFLKRP